MYTKLVGAHRTYVKYFTKVAWQSGGNLTIKVRKEGFWLNASISGIIIAPHASHLLMGQGMPLTALVACAPLGNPGVFAGAGANISIDNVKSYTEGFQTWLGEPLLGDICSGNGYGTFKVEIRVDVTGKYDVFVFFSERHPAVGGRGLRVFSVTVTDQEKHVVENLDIFAEVGMYLPLVLQFAGVNVDAIISIQAIKKTYYPSLCGFMVYKEGYVTRRSTPCFMADK